MTAVTSVAQQRPDRVIVVAAEMHQAQGWARAHGLPFGSIIWAEAEGSQRSLRVLMGEHRLPYVELTPARGETKVMLEVGDHYRIGGA